MKLPFDGDLDPRTQLLPNLIDHYAKTKPDAIYAEYPINPTAYDEGYRQVTYKAFANAINGLAQFLVETLGPGNGEVLAYVGPNDMRYPGLVLGALKAGYCMFMTSPRNSIEAHRSLLQDLDCNTLLTPVPRPPFIGAIQEAHPVKTLEIPSVETLLTTEYPHIEYSKTVSENIHEKFAVVHTSGSTSIPKPIIWKHESAVRNMNMQFLQPPEGCEGQESKFFGKRLFLMLPPFHAGGLAFMLLLNVPAGVTIVIPTSGGLPSLASLLSAREQVSFNCALVPPTIIGELAQDSKALEYCATHLEHITYVGGDVPQLMGNTVAAKLPLMNGYGASETGLLNFIHSPSRDPHTDWRYLHFHPDLGVEMQHVAGDEYEAVIVRSPKLDAQQLPFVLFPHLQEYHTKDLMVRHPTKPDLWRPCARRDDVIVFLNGEKTNPVSMEHHIVSVNPEVSGCLVVGAQRFQAALLVELGGKSLSVNDRAAMIDQLWPSIEGANSVCPAHARIAKSHILFTSPEKPMPRSGKGTVQRAMTLKLYEQEIENLYQDADRLTQLDTNQLPGPGGVDNATKVAEYIRATILAATGWDAEKLTDEENWFNLGLDSLQTITATRILRQGLNLPALSPNVIYLNPTVAGLTHALQKLNQNSEESAETTKQRQLQERDQLLQELTAQINVPAQKSSNKPPVTHTVILTGSTGQLGTYLLDYLLKSSQVEHVYCLDRDESARDRQRERRVLYGLAPVNETRATFWKADLSQTDLGLHSDQLEKLQQTATLVIHNAWTVNFNLSLASFQPQLEGVVNLINFSGQAISSPGIFFISSISSVIGGTETGLIPEALITTTDPAPNGYATSKYIAEHLLGYAAQYGLIHSAFARVGQVSGPIRSPGLWNKSEWFPSIALSSLHLGALPDKLGPTLNRIDWVPIDLLSEILVDLSLLNRSEVSVYHPVNLHSKSWEDVRPAVADALQKTAGKTLDTIPLRNWVLRVRQDIEVASQGDKGLDEKKLQLHLSKNPAAKLLEFFEALVGQTTPDNILDTQKTAHVSEKLREVDAIKPEWIQKWVKEWLL